MAERLATVALRRGPEELSRPQPPSAPPRTGPAPRGLVAASRSEAREAFAPTRAAAHGAAVQRGAGPARAPLHGGTPPPLGSPSSSSGQGARRPGLSAAGAAAVGAAPGAKAASAAARAAPAPPRRQGGAASALAAPAGPLRPRRASRELDADALLAAELGFAPPSSAPRTPTPAAELGDSHGLSTAAQGPASHQHGGRGPASPQIGLFDPDLALAVLVAQQGMTADAMLAAALAMSEVEEEERRQLETAMALSRSQGALLPGWPASGLPQDGGEEAQVRRAQSQSLREAWRAQLPVSVVPTRSAQEARECPLCIGALAPGDRVLHLDCLHSFHEECVEPWIAKHSSCPVCKLEFLEPESGVI